MTVVIAWKTADTIWMGADGRATSGSDIFPSGVKKIYKAKQAMIGYAGFPLMMQLAKPLVDKLCFDSSVDKFALDLKKLLDDNKASEHDDGCLCGEFLLAFNSNLYNIQSNGSVMVVDSYCAIGTGAPYALGFMLNVWESFDRVRIKYSQEAYEFELELALKAASHFCTDCGEPYQIEKMDVK